MDSLGNKFRTARESQGLTLGQMVSRTRIQEKYLKALEEDGFDRLPPKVFAKGFVRSYARSLHLDEEECLRLFSERSASFYEKMSGDRQPVFIRTRDDHTGKTNRNLVLALMGVFLLGLLVLLQQQSPSPSTSSRFSQQTTDQRAVDPQPRDEALLKSGKIGNANAPGNGRPPSSSKPQTETSTVAQTETAHKTEIAETSAESPSADGSLTSPLVGSKEGRVVLELRTLEITWVVVRSDENEPQEALLQPGEIVQWQARERFLLTLGNAGGVEVRLNGQLRGPFGEAGDVARDLELRP